MLFMIGIWAADGPQVGVDAELVIMWVAERMPKRRISEAIEILLPLILFFEKVRSVVNVSLIFAAKDSLGISLSPVPY
jgi:hypothetical protein